jgi:hypothetical protein
LEILADVLLIQPGVCTELADGDKLVGFLLVMGFDLPEQLPPVPFAFACDTLDILWINTYPVQLHVSQLKAWNRIKIKRIILGAAPKLRGRYL